MSFLTLITGGLLFKGGRAEQMTSDCSGLSFSERNAAIYKRCRTVCSPFNP